MRSKRPWKKYAYIWRRELNNGDVKFETCGDMRVRSISDRLQADGLFDDLASAEAHLDAWWANWWPKQVKRASRA